VPRTALLEEQEAATIEGLSRRALTIGVRVAGWVIRDTLTIGNE
jgi:hypothetical protein